MRVFNQLWSFCSGHGLKLPKRSFRRKARAVREEVFAKGWMPDERFHLEMMLADLARAATVRDTYRGRIEHTVAGKHQMIHDSPASLTPDKRT